MGMHILARDLLMLLCQDENRNHSRKSNAAKKERGEEVKLGRRKLSNPDRSRSHHRRSRQLPLTRLSVCPSSPTVARPAHPRSPQTQFPVLVRLQHNAQQTVIQGPPNISLPDLLLPNACVSHLLLFVNHRFPNRCRNAYVIPRPLP